MKHWLFCLICFVSAVGTSVLLLLLEQKTHFKRGIISRTNVGLFTLVAYLVFFGVVGIAIFADRDLVESPVFLGIILGIFYFLFPTTVV